MQVWLVKSTNQKAVIVLPTPKMPDVETAREPFWCIGKAVRQVHRTEVITPIQRKEYM